MGYSIAVHCKNKEIKKKMLSFMLKYYREPKEVFNKRNNYSSFTATPYLSLGFHYNAGTLERHYIYCVCYWMCIKVGKTKQIDGVGNFPCYSYEGCEDVLLVSKTQENLDILYNRDIGFDVVDDLGFCSIEEDKKEAMGILIGKVVDEVDNLIKNELKRLDGLWKKKGLTTVDKEILKECPNGWFESLDLSPCIKNRDYRCRRLEDAGLLKTKIVGPITNFTKLYKVVLYEE